jgi:hypothetical protein
MVRSHLAAALLAALLSAGCGSSEPAHHDHDGHDHHHHHHEPARSSPRSQPEGSLSKDAPPPDDEAAALRAEADAESGPAPRTLGEGDHRGECHEDHDHAGHGHTGGAPGRKQ